MIPTWEDNKPLSILASVLLGILIVFVASESVNSIREGRQIGKPTPAENLIVVDGIGKVIAIPDIATVTLGIETKADTVDQAQEKNTQTMNNLINQIKALGIPDGDIQTQNYSIYENNYWNPETGMSSSLGWIVNQSLVVKVRDTALTQQVLLIAGRNGVTNVYGPNFAIDDQEKYRNDAREKAIADAKTKAEAIAKALNLKLDVIVDYSEYFGNDYNYPYFSERAIDGMGGSSAPDLQPGSQEIQLNATITYRLAK